MYGLLVADLLSPAYADPVAPPEETPEETPEEAPVESPAPAPEEAVPPPPVVVEPEPPPAVEAPLPPPRDRSAPFWMVTAGAASGIHIGAGVTAAAKGEWDEDAAYGGALGGALGLATVAVFTPEGGYRA